MTADSELAALKSAQAAYDSVANVTVQTTQPWSIDIISQLSYLVLGFTCVALVLCTVLLWRIRASAPQVLRAFGVLMIIGMSALLLVVGYSNDQLTPIVGLFGAIAGYLLGKDAPSSSKAPTEP